MSKASRIFVTGSTGFIGSKLVDQLIQRGHSVRALHRKPVLPAKDGLPNGSIRNKSNPTMEGSLEWQQGDILDKESLRSCMEGCDQVYHLAAYAKNWAYDKETFHQMNVEGAQNVFEVARELEVKKIVFTSSIVTLGPTMPGVVGNEEMPRVTHRFFTEYEETKTQAEQLALQMASEGLPIVIVNPTRVYGPGELTEGNSVSKMFLQQSRGQIPFLLNRGINVGNYVHVDDLVLGIMLAMEKGVVGQRYILGGENASLLQLTQWVNEFSGQAHYQINFTPWMANAYSTLQEKIATWLGIYPQVTPGWAKTFLQNWVYDSEKAKRELGYTSRSLREGVRQTVTWLKTLP